MGITTAEDVPPTIEAKIALMSKVRGVSHQVRRVTIRNAAKKFMRVKATELPSEFFKESNSNAMPLSKRMTTSATAVSTLPTLPKSSGVTILSTGPRTKPMRIKKKTANTIF